jgi:hypothetical protein
MDNSVTAIGVRKTNRQTKLRSEALKQMFDNAEGTARF